MSEREYHVSSYVVRVRPEDGQSVSRVIASIDGLEVHAEEDGKLIVTAEAENVRELADLTVGGFIAGIIFWGGFNTALEATNSEEFCISCHEMQENVYQELRQTIHFSNRSGVRATCPDCHVPHNWTDKIGRKMQATKEVWGTIFQTINTREKFLAKRRELAEHEWARLSANDSLECRNCHNFDFMDFTVQSERAAEQHSTSLADGEKTCIDCHKGIAHELPDMAGVEGY